MVVEETLRRRPAKQRVRDTRKHYMRRRARLVPYGMRETLGSSFRKLAPRQIVDLFLTNVVERCCPDWLIAALCRVLRRKGEANAGLPISRQDPGGPWESGTGRSGIREEGKRRASRSESGIGNVGRWNIIEPSEREGKSSSSTEA